MPRPHKPTLSTSGRRIGSASATTGCSLTTRHPCRFRPENRAPVSPNFETHYKRRRTTKIFQREIAMYSGPGVKTDPNFPIPDTMKAWVLGNPGELKLINKPIPVPKRAEVLVRIDAVGICATDLEIIHSGSPASILGGLPFNKNFTPGHEYMGTVAALGPGVDEFEIGERVSVEIHAGCGQCKRCRQGMYTSCLNYGKPDKGHRANGFTTDGGFAEYAVNHINTLARVPDTMSDAEATLVVPAGTAMYGLTELGGLVAGESVVVIGPGPIGPLAVAVGKALGAHPVILK